MTKGILIGLVLGFALGAGVMHLLRAEPEERGSAPDRSDPGRKVESPPPPAPVRHDPAPSLSSPPAEKPAPSNPSRPELDLTDAEIVTACRTLLSGGSAGLPPSEWTRVIGQIWERKLSVPAAVVERLLSSTDPRNRTRGAWLAPWAEPPLTARLSTLTLRDPSPDVRATAIWVQRRRPPGEATWADVLTKAMRDPAARVRIAALNAITDLVPRQPVLGQWVAAGTRDLDPDVRLHAVSLLRAAGPAGYARAREMLLGGEYDLENLDSLMEAAAKGGRLHELLYQCPDPVIVTEIFCHANWEDEALVSAVAGRFEEIFPLYQPCGNEPYDYLAFFELAIAAKETAYLRSVITSNERRRNVRLGALRACLERDEDHALGIECFRAVLRDTSSPARFRQAAIELLGDVPGDLPSGASKKLRAALEETRRSDPSPWVREAAELRLSSMGTE